MAVPKYDPDVQAAFGLAPVAPVAPTAPRYDPDVIASFPQATAPPPSQAPARNYYPDPEAESIAESQGETLGIPGLVFDPQTGKGLLRGVIRGYYAGTSGEPGAREAEDRIKQFGLQSNGSPHAIAGDVMGGVLAPVPGPKGANAVAEAGSEAATAIEEGHALTAVAKSEAGKLESARNAAAAAGIPAKEVTPLGKYLNDAPGRDLNLPKNAAATPGLIDEAINKNAGPIFDAVRTTPAYTLGPKYEGALKGVDVTKIEPVTVTEKAADGTITTRQISMPKPGEATSGSDSLTLSRELRGRADAEYEDAENLNLTRSQRDAARIRAENYKAGAKAVEAGYAEAEPITAKKWDQARQYTARAKAWQGTVDSAGNVNPAKLRRVVSGEPASPVMQDAVTVADQSSNKMAQPSPLRKALNKYGPTIGYTVGGAIGASHGASIGRTVAEHLTAGD